MIQEPTYKEKHQVLLQQIQLLDVLLERIRVTSQACNLVGISAQIARHKISFDIQTPDFINLIKNRIKMIEDNTKNGS